MTEKKNQKQKNTNGVYVKDGPGKKIETQGFLSSKTHFEV